MHKIHKRIFIKSLTSSEALFLSSLSLASSWATASRSTTWQWRCAWMRASRVPSITSRSFWEYMKKLILGLQTYVENDDMNFLNPLLLLYFKINNCLSSLFFAGVFSRAWIQIVIHGLQNLPYWEKVQKLPSSYIFFYHMTKYIIPLNYIILLQGYSSEHCIALGYLEGLQLPDCLLGAALEQLRECWVEAVNRIIPKLLGCLETHILHGLVVLLPPIVVDLTLKGKGGNVLAKFVFDKSVLPIIIIGNGFIG